MNRQDVKFIDAHEPVDDAIRRMHDLADERTFEFRNHTARFRE